MSANKKKNDDKMLRVSVSLPSDHWLAVKRASSKRYVGMSWLIAKLVREWFEKGAKE